MSKSDVLMWLSALGDPWLSGPLAIVLIGLIVWRLRRPIVDFVAKSVGWFGTWKNQRIAICIGLAPIGLIWFWLLFEAISEVWVLTSGVPQEGSGREIADANRNRVQAIFFGVGLIGALLAAIIVPVRLWFQYRQTTTAEQGHITDRLTKAIEQLGAEKTISYRARYVRYGLAEQREGYYTRFGETSDILGNVPEDIRAEHIRRVAEEPNYRDLPDSEKLISRSDWADVTETVPNLEVRLGAIYALERIAQDSERDHITVMETLCAYIRENAPASEAKDHDLGEWPEYPEDASPEDRKVRGEKLRVRHQNLKDWADALLSPRVDIQAALTVIGRRSDERIEFERRQKRSFRLDLRNTNLRKADLTRAKLDHALLTHARMEGAELRAARMERANLEGARMERANLREARMERAELRAARMEWANLSEARMEWANLKRAQMEGANLGAARMEGAYLSEARMEWAYLREASMEKVSLDGARMEGAYLIEARMERAELKRAQMEGANLHSADLKSAALTETFADTSVRAADLRSDSVTQEILNNVFGDTTTKIPDRLHRPDHWDDQTMKIWEEDPKFDAWLESRRKAKSAGDA